MTLRETMARHARTTLVRLDHHGEEVTYHFQDGTPDRVVQAVVDRRRLEPRDGDTRLAAMTATVFLPRHDTLGVEAFTDGDEITLPMRLGATPVRRRITELLSEDEGGFELEVRG